jgi:hypothetical protein
MLRPYLESLFIAVVAVIKPALYYKLYFMNLYL